MRRLASYVAYDAILGLHKYSPAVYDACIASFCALPVSALVDNRFFCVHGGLSPELVTLDDIHRVSLILWFT
jgi:serine/threonine-protein phosphatase 2B catalytic subunit